MTDKEPIQEQIKEFWEWCELKYVATKPKYLSYWVDNNGEQIELNLDLNNLFEYAVPKLKGFRVSLVCNPYGLWTAEVYDKDSDGVYKGDDPALALFWAIREVIKK